jgi:hypothetical protein
MTVRALPLTAAAVLAVMLVMAGPVARAHACTCMPLEPGQALQNAEIAFVGVVAGVRDPSAGNPMIDTLDPVFYTFAVQEVLKQGGGVPAVVEVGSARSGASCGQEFALHQRWRLFAYSDGGSLSTGSCSGNELLAEGVPIPDVGDRDPGPPPAGLLIILGASTLVGVVSILAFTRRGRGASA